MHRISCTMSLFNQNNYYICEPNLTNIYHIGIFFNEYMLVWYKSEIILVYFKSQPSGPVQWYFSCLESKMNGARQGSKHDNTSNEKWCQPSTGQKKEEHIGQFKLFLHRGIDTMHKFLWMCNVKWICEGLYATQKILIKF